MRLVWSPHAAKPFEPSQKPESLLMLHEAGRYSADATGSREEYNFYTLALSLDVHLPMSNEAHCC